MTTTASVTNLYLLNTRLFDNVTGDVTDAEAARRIGEQVNSFAWIAGHALWVQYSLAGLLGLADDNPYAEHFGTGAAFDPSADAPSLSRMRADFDALAPRILAALEALTPDRLDAAAPFPLPVRDQSLRGLLDFQMHHLAYHTGQLGLYRRFLGKAAMSYAPR